MLKLRVCKETEKTVVYKSEGGLIAAYIGDMMILGGFTTLEDAQNNIKRWIAKNEGLQIEA